MAATRVQEVGIRGLRSVAEVRLPLAGLTVLIGDNGGGKSTILEAIELLRRATFPSFLGDLNVIHGGLFALGAPAGFELSAIVARDATAWQYVLRVGAQGGSPSIERETVALVQRPTDLLLHRRGQRCDIREEGRKKPASTSNKPVDLPIDQPALALLGPTNPTMGIGYVYSALQGFDVHVPFEVTPRWIAQAHNRPSELRRSVHFLPAHKLDRLGTNLPNVFAALRNQPNWPETMDLVRMGLGLDVERIAVEADPGGGAAALSLHLASKDNPIPAVALSEGMLAYLCFVGLRQLNGASRSLLAFDEPDLHLHPALLARVVEFFETLAEEHPVVLATHSDALLDHLHDPPKSVVVCELDAERHTRLRSLETAALTEWLADYRGVGALRRDGYLDSVLAGRQASGAGN